MHLRKRVSTFYKDHPEKSTLTSAPLDSAPPMAKPMTQLPTKRKRGQPSGCAKKRAKWGYKEEATRKKQQGRGNKEEATKKRWQKRIQVSVFLRARSRREAEDLSLWRKGRRETCSGSLTIGSSIPKELHSTLSSKSLIIQVSYHLSPLSSKFLIDQTTSFFFPPLSNFPSLSLVQVGRFFH